jgi:hypothetical protein
MNPDRPSSPIGRREFLRTAAQAAATLSVAQAAPLVARGQVLGANDQLGIGFIGVGGGGSSHVHTVQRLIKAGEKARIVAVADASAYRREEIARQSGAKINTNHRDLLANKNVDVVCIATPDRLHVPQALDAIGAGKDVYCEKPVSDVGFGFHVQTALNMAMLSSLNRKVATFDFAWQEMVL